MKKEIDESKFLFWQNELRTVNYFTIKSAFGETERIHTPKDLYKIGDENEYTDDQKEYLLTPLTEEDWKIINAV